MKTETHGQFDRYDEWSSYAIDQLPKEYAFRVEFVDAVPEELRQRIESAISEAMKGIT